MLIEQPDILSVIQDVASLSGDLLALVGTDGASALTEFQTGGDAALFLNDVGAFFNVPEQYILDSWSSFQNSGIAPGNVWLDYNNGSWEFSTDLNYLDGNVSYQLDWSTSLNGAEVQFF
jgi:hypothetical protein